MEIKIDSAVVTAAMNEVETLAERCKEIINDIDRLDLMRDEAVGEEADRLDLDIDSRLEDLDRIKERAENMRKFLTFVGVINKTTKGGDYD
jgi:hypothetical protein